MSVVIPKTLMIGGSEWKIIVGSNDYLGARQAVAESDLYAQVIRIRDDISDFQKGVSLLHEVLHVCCWTAGRRLALDKEEKFINGIDNMLYRTLRENPLEWLLETPASNITEPPTPTPTATE